MRRPARVTRASGPAIAAGVEVGLLIDSLACVILALIVVEDIRRFRIRNVSVLALMALFAVSCILGDAGTTLIWHAMFAAIVLVGMFGAFHLRLLGAGDAKLLSAASLWIGPEGAMVFAIVLLSLTILYCLGAFLNVLPKRRSDGRLKIPFAPSIAIAWLATIAMMYV